MWRRSARFFREVKLTKRFIRLLLEIKRNERGGERQTESEEEKEMEVSAQKIAKERKR